MADLRISDLVTASLLKDDDYYEISQSESGTRVSYKATLLAIAVQIATMVDFTSDLNTTSKKITGAINELKQLISLIPQFSIEVVEELPTEDISDTTIYLVPAEDPEVGNYYEEYIHVNNTWELVGTTAVDLSAYYTKLEVDGLLATKASVAEVALKENKTDMPTDVRTIIKDCKIPKSATITNGIAQFECIEENLVKALKVEMNPIQDFHGYDHQWAGGTGNNKMPALIVGTYTQSGYQAVVSADEKIKVTGTNSGTGNVTINIPLSSNFNITSGQFVHIRNTQANANTVLTLGSIYTGMSPANKIWEYPNTETVSNFAIYIASTVGQVDFTIQVSVEDTNTVTDWTPYENICPISGRTEASVTRTGVNQWDGVWESGDLAVTSTGENHANANRIRSTNYMPVKPNNRYYFQSQAYGNPIIAFYAKDKSYPYNTQNVGWIGTSGVFTTPEWCYYIRFYFNATAATYNNDVSLNYPSTDTEYHAYTAETHTHQYGQEVIGGVDDFANGGLTNTFARIDLSTIPITYQTDNGRFYSGALASLAKRISSNDVPPNFYCECYEPQALNSISGDAKMTASTSGSLFIYDSRFDNIEDFRTAMSGVYLYYELATPTTIQTSAEEITTVEGTNIISGTEPISECKYTELATVDDLIKIIGGQ